MYLLLYNVHAPSDLMLCTYFLHFHKVPHRGAEVRQLPPQQTRHLAKKDTSTVTAPIEIKPIPIGDPKNRSKLTFEVVTARVIESAGKKHVVCY